MFGRFGIVILLMIVLVCTGMISGSGSFTPNTDGNIIPGAIIIIVALVISLSAAKIVRKLPEEKRQTAANIIRLFSVFLCGIGAIVVFSG